jgi:hypothetical protein
MRGRRVDRPRSCRRSRRSIATAPRGVPTQHKTARRSHCPSARTAVSQVNVPYPATRAQTREHVTRNPYPIATRAGTHADSPHRDGAQTARVLWPLDHTRERRALVKQYDLIRWLQVKGTDVMRISGQLILARGAAFAIVRLSCTTDRQQRWPAPAPAAIVTRGVTATAVAVRYHPCATRAT